jgi:putative hydrolase of the HAD superfamily
MRPFVHATTAWIFDLDNTLHYASARIFPFLHQSMTEYLHEHMGLSHAEADALRQRYYYEYGATLRGLIEHHQTDPRHFLLHTHPLPPLREMLVYERGLRVALRRLPGRKILFSNAPAHYAHEILRLLKVGDLFDAVFAIEHIRYRPKPDPSGFYRLLAKNGLKAHQCVMVEDSLRNLRTAKRLGMKTVWVNPGPRSPGWVDVRVGSVLQLPAQAHRLGFRGKAL